MSVSVHTYIHSDLFSDVFLGARGGGARRLNIRFYSSPFLSLFSLLEHHSYPIQNLHRI